MWGLLIANHLDQSLWSSNQKYWAAVRSILILFFGGTQLCCALLHDLVQKNQFPEVNWHIFTFSQSILLSGVHILSTIGDALRSLHLEVSKVWELFMFFGWANDDKTRVTRRGLEPSFKLVIGAQVSCKDKVINQPISQNSVTYLEETYSPY
jgi:hypothetical protein